MTSQLSTNGRRVTAGRSAVLDQPVGTTRTVETTKVGGQVSSRVRRTVLPSGLRVLTEQLPGTRSVALGVWVQVGSMHESPALHGCSHFLEHLLFKGTRRRTAVDLAGELDALGGDANAFTAKEYTCFHARVLDEDLPEIVDLFGDALTDSLITPADVEAERGVILDEIAMHDDDPDDVLHNLLAAQAWGNGPLGRPIAGTTDSIASLSREQIVRFYRRHYRLDNMVVTAAGNLEHGQLVDLVRLAFEGSGETRGEPRLIGSPVERRRVHPGERAELRPFEQVNLVLAVNGLTRRDPRRFVLSVLTSALGGGASSRLFQEVREKRGLAYSVYAFASHHDDAGLVGLAAGCLPAKGAEVLDTLRSELRRLSVEPITTDELRRAQLQLRRGVVLGLEDPSARMARLGKAEVLYGELLPVGSVLRRIDAVTVDQLAELSEELFAQRQILVSVGPGLV